MVSGLLAGMANLVHPCRIPWVQDWGNYVEARAVQAGIDVIPLSTALSMHRVESHLFVDARTSGEYSNKHIREAVSLPIAEMDIHLEALEQVLYAQQPLIVYCRNRECDDALLLALELRAMGESNLLYYVDGFELWEESGCPVETE
jgi:rhodanese-related sulfurtransferase